MEECRCYGNAQREYPLDGGDKENTFRQIKEKHRDKTDKSKNCHHGIQNKEKVEEIADNFTGNILCPLRFHFYQASSFFQCV